MLKLEGLKLAPEEKEAALHRRAPGCCASRRRTCCRCRCCAAPSTHGRSCIWCTPWRRRCGRRSRCCAAAGIGGSPLRPGAVCSAGGAVFAGSTAGGGGRGAGRPVCRAGTGPMRPAPHSAGAGAGHHRPPEGRGDLLAHRRAGSGVQRTIRRGGAGAFSDGKLNTGTKDLRHRWILEELVRCGAPESILTDAKPHVGTDYLHIALKNLRQELLALGAQMRFSATGWRDWRAGMAF